MTTENQTNVLETLVGEGRKFASVEDLAKGKIVADEFVERLKQEAAELRTELAKALETQQNESALERIMSQITNKNPNTVDQGTTPPDQTQNSNNQQGALTQDEIVKLIEAREQAKQEAANFNQAWAKFTEVYGDKAEEALAVKAQELSLDVDTLKVLAKRSPSAFFNTVGLNKVDQSTRSMTSSGRNGESFTQQPVDNGVRDRAYYEKLRQEMGGAKFAMDTKLNAQMWRDITTLGTRFG